MGYFCLNQMFFHIFTDCYISYGIILLFIGLRRVNGTFLLHGLRTEFKRIWPYGHWAGALAPALGGIATTVRSSFRLKSVSNPRKAVKVPFIQRNPMNNDTPSSQTEQVKNRRHLRNLRDLKNNPREKE